MSKDEKEEQIFPCEFCALSFSNKTDVRDHVLETHIPKNINKGSTSITLISRETENGQNSSQEETKDPDEIVPLKDKPKRFEIPTPLNVLPVTPTTKASFKCFLCPNSYYSEGEWNSHAEAVTSVRIVMSHSQVKKN